MTHEKLNSLENQVVVITGANGVVARAVASQLYSIGAKIIGIARQDTIDIRNFYNSISGTLYFADITDTNAISRIAKEITQCDILINNAGWTKIINHKNLEDVTDDVIDKILNVNLKSQFTTIREFLPLLNQSNNALIINISSASANGNGGGSNIMYAASKSAIDGLTKDLARALAPTIRVIAISPPMISDSDFAKYPQESKDRAAARFPLGRICLTTDVANTIEAYATTIRFATGVIVNVDGGRSLL